MMPEENALGSSERALNGQDIEILGSVAFQYQREPTRRQKQRRAADA
jgi:hypothetical protein